MEKYRFKIFYIFLNICFLVIICVIGYFALYPIGQAVSDPLEVIRRKRTLYGLIAIAAIPSIPLLIDYLNKYVLLGDTFMHCNNFYATKFGKQKLMYYRLMYYRIYKLEHKKRLGIFNYYYIYERSMGKPVKISYKFRKHKQLFKKLCENVRNANPNVEIIP